MVETTGMASRVSRMLRLSLAGMALLFWAAAAFALIVPDPSGAIGPLTISLRVPSRVAFQAALVSATALTSWRLAVHQRLATIAAVALVLVTGVLDSSNRRVGDGAEYMAMTLRVADGVGPSLDDDALRSTTTRLEAMDWLDGPRLTGLVRAPDGHWEFQHFWLYSALVAPLAAAVSVVSAHPNVAFTLANAAMVLALVWWLAVRGDYLLALLLGIGPVVWWVDKAHSEVLMVTAIGASGLLAHAHPRWATVAAGMAAAQNPAAFAPLLVRTTSLAVSRAATRADYLSLATAAALAALHPVYYLLRMGRLSPLLHPDGLQWPGLRALVTPLVDPNVGLLAFAPVYGAMIVAGLLGQSTRQRLVTLGVVGLLLLSAAQAGNVNHGGTPGMSRYALWLFAAGLPAAAVAARRLQEMAPVAMMVTAATAAMTWGAFRPALDDGQVLRPTTLAATLWARWPALDNPLPEIFSERTSGRDGAAPVPVAHAECQKILTVGTGTEALFPFPCAPAPAPPPCSVAGALCYVNAGAFVPAPAQRGFAGIAIPERAWTLSTQSALAEVGTALGGDVRTVRAGRTTRVTAGNGVDHLWMVEGRLGLAVWVYPLPDHHAELVLRFDDRVAMSVVDVDTRATLYQRALASGEHRLRLPVARPALVLVTIGPAVPTTVTAAIPGSAGPQQTPAPRRIARRAP